MTSSVVVNQTLSGRFSPIQTGSNYTATDSSLLYTCGRALNEFLSNALSFRNGKLSSSCSKLSSLQTKKKCDLKNILWVEIFKFSSIQFLSVQSTENCTELCRTVVPHTHLSGQWHNVPIDQLDNQGQLGQCLYPDSLFHQLQ